MSSPLLPNIFQSDENSGYRNLLDTIIAQFQKYLSCNPCGRYKNFHCALRYKCSVIRLIQTTYYIRSFVFIAKNNAVPVSGVHIMISFAKRYYFHVK